MIIIKLEDTTMIRHTQIMNIQTIKNKIRIKACLSIYSEEFFYFTYLVKRLCQILQI